MLLNAGADGLLLEAQQVERDQSPEGCDRLERAVKLGLAGVENGLDNTLHPVGAWL